MAGTRAYNWHVKGEGKGANGPKSGDGLHSGEFRRINNYTGKDTSDSLKLSFSFLLILSFQGYSKCKDAFELLHSYDMHSLQFQDGKITFSPIFSF